MSFGIYLHIPFCTRRCDYCDFYSTVLSDESQTTRLLAAAAQELQLSFSTRQWPAAVDTIYIGGGTPSLIEAEHYAGFLKALILLRHLAPEAELTIEANPDSLTPVWLAALREIGVNRLSIGIQSLQDSLLRRLGRLHTAVEAIRAVEMARQAGFDNISLDFIFAIPGQTPGELAADLEFLLELRPQHVAWYCLTWEQGTPLHQRLQTNPDLKLPADDEADRFLQIHAAMTAAGYEHYEVSNYALPGFRSRHNSGYWLRQPCLAVGPSASSFDGVTRWTNQADLETWLESLRQGRAPVATQETVTGESLLLELLYLGLRRLDGVSRADLRQALGDAAYYRLVKKLETSRFSAYILETTDRIKLTLPGILLLDEIILELADCNE